MKTLQVRISDEDHGKAQAVLAEMGLDLPTAVRLFLRKVVLGRALPFPIEASPASAQPLPDDAIRGKLVDTGMGFYGIAYEGAPETTAELPAKK